MRFLTFRVLVPKISCFGWDLGLMVETLGQGSGLDIFGCLANYFAGSVV